jgi:peptidoglycan/LPS O-acetylase OafA/YrhL
VSVPLPRGLAAIDILRFACAMLVLAYHFGTGLPLNANPGAIGALRGTALPVEYAPWTGAGWIGVEIFFVISGYVIAASARDTTAAAFLRRRAQRLLPAAWVCASLSFAALCAVQALPISMLWAQWLRSVLFVPLGQTIDPSYWTLGIEAVFYGLVASQLRGAEGAARLVGLAGVLGAASALFWAIQFCTGDSGAFNVRALQLLLVVHGVFFAIGILLHAGHRDGFTWRGIAALALFLAAAAIEIAAHDRDRASAIGVPAAPAVPILIFAAGVAVVSLCHRVQPWLRWTRGGAATLGLMTYPLYLLHQQIGAVCAGLAARAGMPGGFGLIVSVPLLLGLAWVVVRYAEPPLRRAIGRALSARHGLRQDIRQSAFPSAG